MPVGLEEKQAGWCGWNHMGQGERRGGSGGWTTQVPAWEVW